MIPCVNKKSGGRIKIKPFILLIIFQLIFIPSCKTSDEPNIPTKPKGIFLITAGGASINYIKKTDKTKIEYITIVVLSQNEIPGTISDWKITFKSGNSKLLEITPQNYSSYFLQSFGNPRVYAYNEGSIHLLATSAIPGKLFSLSRPDKMDVIATITDDNSYIQTIEKQDILILYMEYVS